MASRRKKLIISLISLGVVAGILVVGDRVAAGVAEDRISGLIADRAADHGVRSQRPPDVDIAGFPFLTQVLGGEYQQIDINLVDLSSGELTLPRLEIQATSVTAALSDVMNGSGPIVAGRMTADGHISYESLTTVLEEATSATITPLGDGMLEIKANVDVFGQQIPVTGTASVTFDGTVLQVTGQGFTADGVELPQGGQGLLDTMAQNFTRQIAVPELPYGLTLEDLRLEQDAMVVSASAENVPIA
ncbi:Protein of unknown function (DUF2993) [Stackebrandtia albiflava]|uniref:DUF2993 family protein n=1 Tax=Stackebrandtia albiflava TaxID=406432 RepID=A0A562ULG2_9ACTN|nr:DUF2993 domain-containing protein [Stackebrandtia albiflava]TWJ06458.1 Protein of unknown function (DUF2993) [Stackebrandtia albiflava]